MHGNGSGQKSAPIIYIITVDQLAEWKAKFGA